MPGITSRFALVVALALTALHPLTLTAAPTPFRLQAKWSQPPSLVGRHVINWQGGAGVATFHRQGGYTSVWCGQRWIGSWVAKDGVLTVTEAIEPSKPGVLPNCFSWKASLDANGMGGRLPSGGTFTLTPTLPVKVEKIGMPAGKP